MLVHTCLHSALPTLLTDSIHRAPLWMLISCSRRIEVLPLLCSGRQQLLHYPVVTTCLAHSTRSLSSEFSIPKAKLPMILPFFLDFAQTILSRRLSQTCSILPLDCKAFLHSWQPSSEAETEALHSGKLSWPYASTPFTTHHSGCGGMGAAPSSHQLLHSPAYPQRGAEGKG